MKTPLMGALAALCVLAFAVEASGQNSISIGFPVLDPEPAEAFFTLSGSVSFDLLTERTQPGGGADRARAAIIRCWLCQDMSCGEQGFGPATFVRDVEEGGSINFDFTTYFGPWGSADDVPLPPPADLHSYYCNLVLTWVPVFDMLGPLDMVDEGLSYSLVPSYTYALGNPGTRWAKAQEGTNLVVELTGTIN